MKKIITTLFILTLGALLLCSCGKKNEAVKQCEEKIAAIGDVSPDDLPLIEEAENAYKLLSEEEKKEVKSYEVLQNSRKVFDNLTTFGEKADALNKKLKRVFSQSGIKADEIDTEYKDLLKIYNEFTPAQQNLFPVFKEIQASYEKYNSVADTTYEAAAIYVKGFMQVNKDKKYEVTDIGCIVQTNDDKDHYIFALTYKDGEKETSVYANARFSGVPAVESIVNFSDNFFASAPTSEKNNALEFGNVTLDLAKVLAEAGK